MRKHEETSERLKAYSLLGRKYRPIDFGSRGFGGVEKVMTPTRRWGSKVHNGLAYEKHRKWVHKETDDRSIHTNSKSAPGKILGGGEFACQPSDRSPKMLGKEKQQIGWQIRAFWPGILTCRGFRKLKHTIRPPSSLKTRVFLFHKERSRKQTDQPHRRFSVYVSTSINFIQIRAEVAFCVIKYWIKTVFELKSVKCSDDFLYFSKHCHNLYNCMKNKRTESIGINYVYKHLWPDARRSGYLRHIMCMKVQLYLHPSCVLADFV